ncbi:PREDICTED: uncharacterized protein LOC105557131 [Vollenhovia emeryi]|uniref:uncharacterized protein LOC105557131 n=1 Tax=Vollenhovia emeryi TaxID=411798 RepID=UPI0005F39C7B|nr:PREDICTED: uncharacterized protein LOC105557131 [Vollenhovia emeryi]
MKNLTLIANDTKRFLREHPEIIITRADKGHTTIAIDRHIHREKWRPYLMIRTLISQLRKIPQKKLISSLHKILMDWKKSNYIDNSIYRRLNCTDGTLPRAYGLPKIHKPECPLRIIVSSVDSPLYSFSFFLHNIIKSSTIPKPQSHILNSYDLVNKLNGRHIQETHDLISLDVVSLFTNIPLDLAEDSITTRWTYISEKCAIPQEEFLKAIRFVLKSTYFSFNGKIYQQTFGTPMGSPLSPIIADITMQDLENRAIELLNFRPPFYFRYVDDIALAVPSHMKDSALQIFNSFHPRLQFTIEEGTNRKLNFLDTTIIIRDDHIEFDWYQKPTFSGRYLNFESCHTLSVTKKVQSFDWSITLYYFPIQDTTGKIWSSSSTSYYRIVTHFL